VAFDSRPTGNPQILVTETPFDSAKPLTSEKYSSQDPIWSPDGKWLYFASNRSGRSEIYRSPSPIANAVAAADPRQAEKLTAGGGSLPSLSPDGGTLLYRRADRAIAALDLGTRTEQALAAKLPVVIGPILASGALAYSYFSLDRRASLARIKIPSGEVERLIPLPNLSRASRLARSPDGRQIIFGQADRDEADLMQIDDLRR